MRYLYLPFILLLITNIMAYDCTGYTDSFSVLVVDAKLRPVEGAAVQVKYDPGTSFGDVYYTTPIKYTGADGKLNYTLRNQGTAIRESDCSIRINATKTGETKTVTIDANLHSTNVVLQIPLYRAVLTVRDQYGQAISNATVEVRGETKKTDEYGRAVYSLPEGKYEYFVSYKTGKQSQALQVQDDVEKGIVLEYHKLAMEITDDQGTPLKAMVTVNNETSEADGRIEYERIYGTEIPYEVSYEGIKKTGTVDLNLKTETHIIFDFHAPVFGNVNTTTEKLVTRLLIPVKDEGEYASGLDYKSIKVSYKLEPSEETAPWNNAVTFGSSVESFMADFQNLPENSIVRFRIEIQDIDGNKATLEGRFSPAQAEPPKPPNETDKNGGGIQENGNNEQEIPLIYIVIGVMIVILIIFVVLRMKSKQNNSGEEQ